jgi:hypothetical protein
LADPKPGAGGGEHALGTTFRLARYGPARRQARWKACGNFPGRIEELINLAHQQNCQFAGLPPKSPLTVDFWYMWQPAGQLGTLIEAHFRFDCYKAIA